MFEVKLRLDLGPKGLERIAYASNLQVNVIFDAKPPGTPPAVER